LERLTGVEQLGAPEAAKAASATDGFGTVETLLMANHYIVRARNVASKLSFACGNFQDRFSLCAKRIERLGS
jgi:hypothetical protein